ncbi:MAG: hypothetical protein SGJ09_14950 [Phycisphaerae bacterium]|nr:hypothetical protein [Phycisphaerae bacterium]
MRNAFITASTVCCAIAAPSSVVAAQSWEFGPPMPAPKTDTFAVNYNGAIYVVGGSPWSGVDEDGTVYQLANGGWSEVAILTGMGPVVGQGGGVDALNHMIVFGGLTTPSGDIAESRAYDPTKGPIFTVTDPPSGNPPINFGAAVDGEGRVYRMGGGPGAVGFNNGICARYIAATNSWEDVASLPFTRASIASAYDGVGHIWGFGGYTSFGTFRLLDTIRYTVATDTWENMGSLFFPIATSNGEAVLGADGRLYIIGGFEGTTGTTTSATVRIIDPTVIEPVLLTGPSLNVARHDFSAALGDDGYIYVMGGYSSAGVPIASVERLYTGVTQITGDLDQDGDVDAADLGVLLGSWGRCSGCAADLNGDNAVDAADLGILLGAWTS